MKKLLVLVLAMAIAGSAFAVVDPDPDMLGVYFDTTADTYCLDGAAGFTYGYVIMTMPSAPITGFQYGLTVEGMAPVLFANFPGLNVDSNNLTPVVGFANPVEPADAVVLGEYGFNFVAGMEAMFSLGGHPTAPFDYDAPAVVVEVGGEPTKMPLGYSTIDGIHCAVVNGACDVVATEDMSFDGVKSLYR